MTNLASRVEELAEAGRVYLTENTARLAEGYFALRDLREFELKGVSETVRVHELEAVGEFQTRFDVSRARGLSRFVDRERTVHGGQRRREHRERLIPPRLYRLAVVLLDQRADQLPMAFWRRVRFRALWPLNRWPARSRVPLMAGSSSSTLSKGT